MKIENSQMLQDQMNIGSRFTLDKQGDIQTQGKISAFFQSIGDKFRSTASINARNTNLMVAMGRMLRDGATPAPLNGPRNLAAQPAMNAEERAVLIEHAQKAIMQSAIQSHLETTYGQQSTGVKDAIQHHITTRVLTAKPKNITDLKAAMHHEIARSELNAELYANSLAPCAHVSAKTTEELAPQRAFLADTITKNMQEDIGINSKFPQNTYVAFTLDGNRNLPVFNGVRTTHENLNTTLAAFSQNPIEERMVGYICSQTATSAFLASTLGTEGPALSAEHINHASPLLFGIANAGPFSISREDNGDVLIQRSMHTNVRGMFDNIDHSVNHLGMLDYTIRVPHEQFATYANASHELAQLGTPEEKDAYMTGILQDFEPQIEINQMTLTPPQA